MMHSPDTIALARQPHQFLGMARIMRIAFASQDLTPLAAILLERIRHDDTDASAMLDMCTILQLDGQPDKALEFQAVALSIQQHYSIPHDDVPINIRVLALFGPGVIMANTPIEFLIENSDVSLEILYVGAGMPIPEELPEHDIAFVAVCQSDESMTLLHDLQRLIPYWPRPYINSPARIADLGRETVSQRLADVPGCVVSNAARLSRALLTSHITGNISSTVNSPSELEFPAIVRPVNSHAGQGLEKIDSLGGLTQYLERRSEEEFYVAPFIDYRSADGWYRKYRVVVIAGKAYAAHMAISQKWMVHYLNADMLNNSKNRDEESRFMLEFETGFGRRHHNVLAEVTRIIGLEYYSLDCAEMPDGRLLIFEVDSGAVVHSMDPEDIFPYKHPQMKKVFAAFRELLDSKLQSVQEPGNI